eukprot:422434-Hanusia_phi.AAC.2
MGRKEWRWRMMEDRDEEGSTEVARDVLVVLSLRQHCFLLLKVFVFFIYAPSKKAILKGVGVV